MAQERGTLAAMAKEYRETLEETEGFSEFSTEVDTLFDDLERFLVDDLGHDNIENKTVSPQEEARIFSFVTTISQKISSYKEDHDVFSQPHSERQYTESAERKLEITARLVDSWELRDEGDYDEVIDGTRTELEVSSEDFDTWNIEYSTKLGELDDLIEEASDNYTVYAAGEVYTQVYDEYVWALGNLSEFLTDTDFFETRFELQEKRLSSKKNLVYIYDLEDALADIREKKAQAGYSPDDDIIFLQRLIKEATISLGELDPHDARHYKQNLIPTAGFLVDDLIGIQLTTAQAELKSWKKKLEEALSDEISDIDSRLVATSEVSELQNLIIEVDENLRQLPGLRIDSILNEEVTAEIEEAKVLLNELRERVTAKLKEEQGVEDFAAEELAIKDYLGKVEKLEGLIKKGLDDNFKPNNTVPVIELIYALEDELVEIKKDKLDEKNSDHGIRLESIRLRIFGDSMDGSRTDGEYDEVIKKLKALDKIISSTMDDVENQMVALNTNYLAAVNSKHGTEISKNADKMRSLVEHQSGDFTDLMELYFRFRDGYNPNTTKNVEDTLMYARSSSEARHEMRIAFNTQELIAFSSMEEVTFEDPHGHEYEINVKEIIEKLEHYFETVTWQLPGSSRIYSYAINGNPEKGAVDEHGNPIPRIEERIVQDFPELSKMPSFVLEAFKMFIPLAEMRKKHLILNFAEYRCSPIPGIQDFEDLDIIAPMAQHLYNVQSSTFIDIGLHPYLFDLPNARHLMPGELASGKWDVRDLRLTLPKDKVGYKIPMEDHVDFILPSGCKNRKNIFLSRQIEEVLRTFLSPVEIGKVQLTTNLQILPSFYDIIKGEFDGKKLLYRPTLEEYNDLMTNIKGFYNFIHKEFRPLKDIHDLDTHVGEMIAKAKLFKGIFGVLNTDEDELFTPYIQLLMKVYMKKLFNSYRDLVAADISEQGIEYLDPKYIQERSYFSLQRFISVVSPMLRSSKTLPQHLVDTARDTSGPAAATRFALGAIFDEIEAGSNVVGNNLISRLMRDKLRGFSNMFTKGGVFFDNNFEAGKIEEILKQFKHHHFYKYLEIYARPKNLAADEKDK